MDRRPEKYNYNSNGWLISVENELADRITDKTLEKAEEALRARNRRGADARRGG